MPPLRCPFCQFGKSWSLRRGKRKCKSCRREFAGKTYPVSGIRATTQQWEACIKVFLRERTVLRIQSELGIGYRLAQKMGHYLRVCMLEDLPGPFSGPVEMDETYIGGQRKNKRLHIRRIEKRKGHGTEKLPIVGLLCRTSGQVIVDVEPKKLDVAFIFGLIQKHVVPGAAIYTDAFKMYRGLPRLGYRHEYVDHYQGEMVRGDVHTNNIEGFWGILKRRLGCIGGMRRARLRYFVAEIVWKFNHRHLPLKEQERALLRLILGSQIGG